MDTLVREKQNRVFTSSEYRIKDFPKPYHVAVYQRAVEEMAERVSRIEGVHSVYQIGNVSTPGISDIDMLVVVKDGCTIQENPLLSLSSDQRYLFVHGLFGVPGSLLQEAKHCFFLNNYRLLSGSQYLHPSDLHGASGMPAEIRAQVALEYLVKMYITLYIQKAYKVFKLRGIFLHAKALAYDLELLNVSSGALYEAIQELIEIRGAWFSKQTPADELLSVFLHLEDVLRDFLEDAVSKFNFYLPGSHSYRIARSIRLTPGTSFFCRRSGVMLPSFLSGLGKSYYALRNRLQRFDFEVPAVTSELPHLVEKRFLTSQKLRDYNTQFLPHFLPFSTSLNVG